MSAKCEIGQSTFVSRDGVHSEPGGAPFVVAYGPYMRGGEFLPGHRFPPEIVRAYDIRGTFGENLNDADAYYLGRAFATIVRRTSGRCVSVGRDGRTSSPILEKALVRGLLDGGIDVFRIGVAPSPVLYYACHHLPVDGGIVVTGSHNPKDMNGFKFVFGREPLHGGAIQELAQIAQSGEFTIGHGRSWDVDVTSRYLHELVRTFSGSGSLHVAWDCGNGATGPLVCRLAGELSGRNDVLNAEVDGTFPNHHPDPSEPANLEQLVDHVIKHKCDLGVAFDGDGDRIGVVDDKGEIVWVDQILSMFAKEILAIRPGAPIVADIKCSQVLFEEIERLGGIPVMARTGRPFIREQMKQIDAPLAGEMSGHIFFADRWYGFDDALYAAIRLLSLISAHGTSLSQIRQKFPVMCSMPEQRMPCDESLKGPIVEGVRRQLRNDKASFLEIDGVRVDTEDGWWLLRASNTEPVLSARCEAKDMRSLARIRRQMTAYLRQAAIGCSAGQVTFAV